MFVCVCVYIYYSVVFGLSAFYWFSFRILLQKSKVKNQGPGKKVPLSFPRALHLSPCSPAVSLLQSLGSGGLAIFIPQQAQKGKRPMTQLLPLSPIPHMLVLMGSSKHSHLYDYYIYIRITIYIFLFLFPV